MTIFPVSARGAILAALSVAALTSTTAYAGAIPFESNGRTANVRYDDLDLSSPADQRILNTRIRHAAAKVCPAPTMGERRVCQSIAINQVREPVTAAIARAQAQDASRFAEVGTGKVAVPGN